MAARQDRAPSTWGRDVEWAMLDEATRRAGGGRGGVVLLAGEPGIGKSHLVQGACALAPDLGLQVRAAAAEELEQVQPFGPLVRALGIGASAPHPRLADVARALGLGVTAPGAPAAATPWIGQEALTDLVEELCLERPLLLAIDDLQWADAATLATLVALCRRAADLPLLVLLAHRPRLSDAAEALVAAALAAGATHLELAALDRSAVEALVEDLLGTQPGPSLVAQVDGARGNAFFVIELIRALQRSGAVSVIDGQAEVTVPGMPPTLRQAILRRVRSLSAGGLDLLRAAAVLGRPFELDEIAGMLERTAVSLHDDAMGCLTVGLLEEDGDRLRIRHDLIREAVHDDAPGAIRTSLHEAAVDVLTKRGEPASVLVPHLLGAPGTRLTVERLRTAAGVLAPGDPAVAITLLDRASEIAGDDTVLRHELQAERIGPLSLLGRLTEAEQHIEEALRTAGPRAAARLRMQLAEVLLRRGDAHGAVQHYRAARASGALNEAEVAAVLADTAWARLLAFDLERAATDAEQAQCWAEEHGDGRIRSQALSIRCRLAAFAADFDRAIELGRAAVEADADRGGALHHTPDLYLGLSLLNADRGEEAIDVLAAGRLKAEAAGSPWAVASYHNALIMCGFHAGAWDDATAEAEAARSLHVEAATRAKYVQLESMLGLIWLHRGRYDEARDARQRAEVDMATPGHDAGGVVWLLWLQAGFAELEGALARASQLLRRAFDLAVELRVHSVKLWYGPETVRLTLAAGDADAAAAVAAEVSRAAELAGTETARGAEAWCRGQLDEDAGLLRAAAEHYRNTARRFDLARVDEHLGQALARTHPKEAAAALEESIDLWEGLGAEHDLRRVTAALRRLGVRRGSRASRQRAKTGPDSLTPTERRVLELVGTGLRNAEIASRLYVSRRTVETHVGRLYAKLEVSSRVDLARLAGRTSDPRTG